MLLICNSYRDILIRNVLYIEAKNNPNDLIFTLFLLFFLKIGTPKGQNEENKLQIK